MKPPSSEAASQETTILTIIYHLFMADKKAIHRASGVLDVVNLRMLELEVAKKILRELFDIKNH